MVTAVLWTHVTPRPVSANTQPTNAKIENAKSQHAYRAPSAHTALTTVGPTLSALNVQQQITVTTVLLAQSTSAISAVTSVNARMSPSVATTVIHARMTTVMPSPFQMTTSPHFRSQRVTMTPSTPMHVSAPLWPNAMTTTSALQTYV